MKVDIRLMPETLLIITATLQGIYRTKADTKRNKSTLSIALDVVSKLDSKCGSVKSRLSFFEITHKVKITFKFHEAYVLELLLIQEITSVTDSYIRQQIQRTIDDLNQKLA